VTAETENRPFNGIKVLDFSQGIAGPHCGMLLAHYGADVIKIEPPGGDWSRPTGIPIGDMSAMYVTYNQGKRGVTIDLRSEDGLAKVKDLAATADVIIQNYRPGLPERMGIGYEDLSAINDRLIYVSISGYGQIGPKATHPGTDAILQASTGLVTLNAGNDGVPHRVRMSAIDHVAGMYAFQAVCVDLYARLAGRTLAGQKASGRHIDISLLQSVLAFQGAKILEYDALDGNPPAEQYCPLGIYKTKDDLISITTIREKQFADLCHVIGCPELITDPRYATSTARIQCMDEVNNLIEARTVNKTTAEWMELFTAKGVLHSPIRTYADLFDDPQVLATNSLHWVDQPGFVRVPITQVPGSVLDNRRPAPQLGEHNDEIL